MARLDKVHLTVNGNLRCNPGLKPTRYQTTENPDKATCFRCVAKTEQMRKAS